jgi:hypothetical protein
MRMNTNLAQELLERHTVAINVAVEDGSCFMVSEQDALDAIRAALSHATSIDVQVGLPPLPPVDGYDKRIQGHYSAQQMQDYARAALAATGKQQAGEVVLYQIRQEIVGEDSWGSSNGRVKERLNAWRDISKSHYDAYLSVMGGCGPAGVLGHPDGPVELELNQYASTTEIRALYAAPPSQGIDLGEKDRTMLLRCLRYCKGDAVDDGSGDEIDRLISLIDGRDAGRGVGS